MSKQKLAEEVIEPTEVKKPSKALSPEMEEYKKLHPAKFEAKLASGELANKGLLTLLAVLIGVGCIFGSVKAFQSYTSPKVVVEGNYIEAPNSQVDSLATEPQVGAVVSADSMPSMVCSANECTYSATGAFIDASTTIVSVPDPFLMVTTTDLQVSLLDQGTIHYTGATSSVSMARLSITGVATTTFTVSCGAASTPIASPTLALISSGSVSTSTGKGAPIENNLTAALGGQVDGGTTAKITVGASLPYFNCVVTPNVAAGFTNTGNTFTGFYSVKFSRTRY